MRGNCNATVVVLEYTFDISSRANNSNDYGHNITDNGNDNAGDNDDNRGG